MLDLGSSGAIGVFSFTVRDPGNRSSENSRILGSSGLSDRFDIFYYRLQSFPTFFADLYETVQPITDGRFIGVNRTFSLL